jgi:RND family efflux transporter MFP subunit
MRSVLLVPFAAGALLLPACRSREGARVQAAASPTVTASTVVVRARPFTASIPITGSLVSRTRVEIRAETFGRVVRFPKEEGNPVRAGEPVLWVDEENYRLALKQAESAVQVAEVALARARVLAAHSLAELERAENLIKSGGITDKDLKMAVLSDQDSRSQVKLAEAQLEQSRTAVDIARKKLADTVVKAPVSGEIQKKYVNVGAYVEAPTPVFSIVDNGRLELEAPVPAPELAQVRPGQRVSFSVSSFPGEKFVGTVVEIAPAVDAESRAAKVRVEVPNTAARLRSGMFVEGEILTGVESRAIIIPATAVYRSERAAGEGSAFVIHNGQAVRRHLRLGREHDGAVEVASGLNEGDVLIIEQSLELAEGVKVQPRGGAHVPE